MEDIMKISKFIEESGLLRTDVSETIRTEAKEKKRHVLGTLGASILGSMPPSKGVIRGGDGVIRAGEGVIRAGQDF